MYLLHPVLGNIRIPSTPAIEWGFGHSTRTSWFTERCDDSTIYCHTSIQIYNIDESIYEIIDAKIDNADGPYSGSIRLYKNPDPIINII